MIRRSRLAALALSTLTFLSAFGFFTATAHAQVDAGLDSVAEQTGLSTDDPRAIAARIINVSLSVLGIILVCIIIYAGFLWMTAGGDGEKVEKAKMYIRNAVIGLLIILSAWAIALFVIRALAGDGGSGDISGGGGGNGGGGFGSVGAAAGFRVTSITPSGSVSIRNVKVRFFFSRPVRTATVSNETIRVLRDADKTPVEGTLVVDPVNTSIVSFVPSADCPGSNGGKCFDGDATYIAQVVAGSSLTSQPLNSTLSGEKISCGAFSPCEVKFTTGNKIDITAPTAVITDPWDGQAVPQNALVSVFTRAEDDSAISYVETYAAGKSIGRSESKSLEAASSFEAKVIWDTVGIATGTEVALRSQAFDIDDRQGWSPTSTVIVRAAHCFNKIKDADETAVDCGGECGACNAGACVKNTDCASGVCSNGTCVEQPVISGVSPLDGRAGTFVTIQGLNFGSRPGKVFFGDTEATAPAVCAEFRPWSSSQVIVTVPATAKTGPIRLVNTSANLEDTTANDRGPKFTYTVNDVARPGLCGVVPDRELVGASILLKGAGLGAASERVYFDDREYNVFDAWTDESISLRVPNIAAGGYSIKAQSNKIDSNAVRFEVSEPVTVAAPVIDSVDPVQGPIGEYVTLLGRNFGSLPGTVKFRLKSTQVEVLADVSFPPLCSTAYWQDTSIVVKVPKEMQDGLGKSALKVGDYEIYVVRPGAGSTTSAAIPFRVVDGTPKPGICLLQPAIGPVRTAVTVIGERLGETGSISFQGKSPSQRVEAAVAQGGWKSTEIKTTVPVNAGTGVVAVQVNGRDSNRIPFQVQNCNEKPGMCGVGISCCPSGQCSVNGSCPQTSINAEFAWRMSTGRIPVNPEVVEECVRTGDVLPPPSPSPWDGRAGGDQACINSDIIVRFNTTIDEKSVKYGDTFIVRSCDDAGENPCAKTTLLKPRAGYPKVALASGDAQNGTSYIIFRFDPAGSTLAPSKTYEVYLTQGIRALAGAPNGLPLLRNVTRCGNVGGSCAYTYRFTTRNSATVCKVGKVGVTPNPSTAKEIGQTIDHQGVALSADDICIKIDGSGLNWQWEADRGRGRASVTNNKTQLGNVSEEQVVTALREAVEPVAFIDASVKVDDGSVKGTGSLTIRFIPPRVESYGPNCDEACINAALWAQFNVPMQPNGFAPETVVLRRCTNENCRAYDASHVLRQGSIKLQDGKINGQDIKNSYLFIEPTDAKGESLLLPGRFYRVTLKNVAGFPGGPVILSNSGLGLTGLNDPEGFSWVFRVRPGNNAFCAPAKIDVQPQIKIESVVGDRQSFVATPLAAPDACNKNGQPLISNGTYAWSSVDEKVAQFVDGRGQMSKTAMIDTSNNLPSSCRGNCLNAGAKGVFGKTASCGNGLIETTNPRFCQKRSDPSKPCDVNNVDCSTVLGGVACKVLPPGATGGEECDDGANNGKVESGCTNACLFKPVVGKSCGNGQVELGEQCDEGGACVGGEFAGKSCKNANECGGSDCKAVERNGCSIACQALGSMTAASTCGNGDVGDGETCDDGNVVNGDGCSSACLHEGSRPLLALCGNGLPLEPGESCEAVKAGDPLPSGCDANTCLNKGTSACEQNGQKLCCGNGGAPEPGEDCDNGKGLNTPGSGCSARCLFEGSSIAYAVPSFCGDGERGTGEQCEADQGDGKIDRLQLSEVVAKRDPLVSEVDGVMKSALQATYEKKTGEGTHGIQCGYKAEADCKKPGTGLTTGGCCANRPAPPMTPYPLAGAGSVCRNVLISATFAEPMDGASITGNAIVAEKVNQNACPNGTVQVSATGEFPTTWYGRVTAWAGSLWRWAWGKPATAAVYCAGGVNGTWVLSADKKTASFRLNEALKSETEYRVVFRGDRDLSDDKKEGIRTEIGVVAEELQGNPTLSWTFTTGKAICTAKVITVKDLTPPARFFSKPGEAHDFEAAANAINADGVIIPLSPINEYTWAWQPWVSSEDTVLKVGPLAQANGKAQTVVTSENKNGTSLVFASLKVTQDKVNTPSTENQIIASSVNATVMLCERPWPARAIAPFADQSKSPSLNALAPLFNAGPFYNFSTAYCMDRGEFGAGDDLPQVELTAVAPAENDQNLGVLRQYLLTYIDADFKKDGIGIRIVQNPLHLSPAAWYKSRGFAGTPVATTLDGYEAVRDETTIYAATANVDDQSGAVYSNILVMSHNPDATPETKGIFEQLVNNFSFNINLKADSQNACVYVAGNGKGKPANEYLTNNGIPVRCTADWECAMKDIDTTCASLKSKLRRDTRRVADMQAMSARLDAYQSTNGGRYPLLNTGTYLQTISTSLWPSWQQTFGATVGGSVPTDPVNRYMTCGRCSKSKNACTTGADCPASETCDAQGGYDPATCWNDLDKSYQCPILGRSNHLFGTPSRLYQYRAIDGGVRYELSTELEGPSAGRYVPSLLSEVKRCSNIGTLCAVDKDCDYFGPDGKKLVSTGTCNAVGGKWEYVNLCRGQVQGSGVGGSVCGNGKVEAPDELCEVGDVRPIACDNNKGTKVQVCADCKAFVDAPSTKCVANALCGNGRLDRYKCNVEAGGPGYKYGQACNLPTALGQTSAECSDPRDPQGTRMICSSVGQNEEEVCDDGALNGLYGRCARNCKGYGAVCGDGQLSVGETCDNGLGQGNLSNGDYCEDGKCNPVDSCAIDCKGPAPYCGDQIIKAPEEMCDGNTEKTTKALCSKGRLGESCDVDADCNTQGQQDGKCGDPQNVNSTNNVCILEGRCSNNKAQSCKVAGDCAAGATCNQYPTVRSRTCPARGTPNACQWKGGWSSCQPEASCGNGKVDGPDEQCDDGNQEDNDSCTSVCRKNVCGDNILNPGVEQCDYGNKNGDVDEAGDEDYGSTKINCSNSCTQVARSGGFCGDTIKNGPEQCDAKDFGTDQNGAVVKAPTCKSLGYDYGEATNIKCATYDFCRDPGGKILEIYSGGCKRPLGVIVDGVFGGPVQNNACPDQAFCQFTVSETKDKAGKVTYTVSAPLTNNTLVEGNNDPKTSAPSLNVCKGVPTYDEAPATCTNTCGFGGCYRCQDQKGNGQISGQVFDAIYFNQPVPNARVTMYSKGIKISEVLTDDSGNFSIAQLNTRPECANYRLVIDYYKDNPKTPNADEAKNGGYWPHESSSFSPMNFQQTQNGGKFYLIPRVALNETLVVTLWNGSLAARFLDAHLVLPKAAAYKQKNPNNVADGFVACDPSKEKGCQRDISWADEYKGVKDLSKIPNAYLYCISSAGGDPESCGGFNSAPETLKYRRGDQAVTGKYSYYLVDYPGGAGPLSYEFFRKMEVTVYVATREELKILRPPAASPACKVGQLGSGKYWLAFQQDANSGAITIPTGAAGWLCTGSAMPDEDPGVLIPGPMSSVGNN